MTRGAAIATAVFVTVVGTVGMRAAFAAQGGPRDPFAGTWKLNLAKSKYNAGTPPRSEVRTYEAVGDPSARRGGLRVSDSAQEKTFDSVGEKLTVHGVAADGSPVEWGYTVKFDGKYYPITGNGPGGADAIAVRRVSARKVEATLAKGGKPIETASREVSEDGKTMTATARVVGSSASATLRTGGPPLFVIVYDRQ